ncbi:hypothetical protein BKI52_01915 [marine bacterium AO1-C]|nr:hypothetical protein BKI52_01915 [marine bacterium AO1-C]
MRNNIIVLLLLLGVITTGCVKTNDVAPFVGLIQSDEIIVDNNLFANAPNDAFKLISVQINDNHMELEVEYAGGCGDVNFKLIGNEEVKESAPPQRAIRLSLQDDDDCGTMLRQKLSFALNPAQVQDYNELLLQLQDWTDPLSYKY